VQQRGSRIWQSKQCGSKRVSLQANELRCDFHNFSSKNWLLRSCCGAHTCAHSCPDDSSANAHANEKSYPRTDNFTNVNCAYVAAHSYTDDRSYFNFTHVCPNRGPYHSSPDYGTHLCPNRGPYHCGPNCCTHVCPDRGPYHSSPDCCTHVFPDRGTHHSSPHHSGPDCYANNGGPFVRYGRSSHRCTAGFKFYSPHHCGTRCNCLGGLRKR